MGDIARDQAVMDAARLRRRYPDWDIWADRVRGGWAVQAVPHEDDGSASAVIGTADEVEGAIREATA